MCSWWKMLKPMMHNINLCERRRVRFLPTVACLIVSCHRLRILPVLAVAGEVRPVIFTAICGGEVSMVL